MADITMLLLFTAITLFSKKVLCNPACNAQWCDPNFEPKPNIMALMTGYHILKGNPFSENRLDPGFTNFIFNPTEATGQNRYKLVNGITVLDSKICNSDLNTVTMTTVTDLKKKISEKALTETKYSSGYDIEVKAEIEGVGVSTTIPPMIESSFSSSKEFKENKRFFTESQGILTMNEATCTSYSYKVSRYQPPPLTDDFVAAINDLHAVTNLDSNRKQQEFDKFIDTFGTHFIDTAIMGSRMAITRRYSRDEYQKSSETQITNCNKERFTISFFSTVSRSKSNCKDSTKSSSEGTINELKREYITSYGSSPKDNIYDWTNQDFKSPSPIRMSLSPILNLFTKAHMGKHNIKGYKEVLRWIAPYYDTYCERQKKSLNINSCTPQSHKGCGWNDNCKPRTEHCINEPSKPNGYFCCSAKCQASSPCQNGGICVDVKSTCGYTCSCVAPYSGKDCTERNLDSNTFKSDILARMQKFKDENHETFKSTILNYLQREYPLYYFVVISYKEISGWDKHALSYNRNCAVYFRKEGRNVVACYAEKDTNSISYTNQARVFNDAKSALTDYGCHAKESLDKALTRVRSYGYSYMLTMVVREKNGLEMDYSGNTVADVFRCKEECGKSFWGKRKCENHMSRLIIMFG